MAEAITVYTVVTGARDHVRAPDPAALEPGVRWVCYADEPTPAPPPWEVQPLPVSLAIAARPALLGDAHRLARLPKMLSHLFADTPLSIYHDACLAMTVPPSAAALLLRGAPLALLRHPVRGTIEEERDCCVAEGIGDPVAIATQVEAYRAAGLPRPGGLWCGGFIIRRACPETELFNETWLRAFLVGGNRDQIALPWAIWRSGVGVTTVDMELHANPVFQFYFHAAHLNSGDIPTFATVAARRNARAARLAALLRA